LPSGAALNGDSINKDEISREETGRESDTSKVPELKGKMRLVEKRSFCL
jgi:hypothetical protein